MVSISECRLASVRFCAAASDRMSFRLCTTRRMPSCTSSRMAAICRSCWSRRSVTVIPTDYHGVVCRAANAGIRQDEDVRGRSYSTRRLVWPLPPPRRLAIRACKLSSVRFCASAVASCIAASLRRSLRVSRAKRRVSTTILMPSLTRSRMTAICLSCWSRRCMTVIPRGYHVQAANLGTDPPVHAAQKARLGTGRSVPGGPLGAFGVAAEDAEEVGDLAEVVEGVDGDGGIGASEEVQIEEVFPGFAAKGAGFNLDHVEIAQGEGAEGTEQGTGDVASAEYERSLPLGVGGGAERMAACVIGSAQEEEAGKILAVAFDGAAQDVGAVDFGGDRTGDPRGVGQPFFGDHLYAAGGIVKRNSFDLRVPGKEIQTLIQRHRMGESAFDLGELEAFGGDQVVYDAHAGFGHDGQFEVHQVVVVLMDAAGEGIFDGHDGASGATVLDGAEDVFKTGTGEHFGAGAELPGGLLAEGTALPLEGNDGAASAHRATPSQRRTRRSGRPMRSRTRSMLVSTRSSTVCGW